MEKIIGPFTQVLTMDGLATHGPLRESALEVLENAAVLIRDENIAAVGSLEDLIRQYPDTVVKRIKEDAVLMPGFVDAHTHLCWAGDRAKDFAMRLDGRSYLEIAEAGGGIWSTVQHTREASDKALTDGIAARADRMLRDGVTTIEVKSGYGLSVDEELRILRAVRSAKLKTRAFLMPTCLAAHMKPHDFDGTDEAYLDLLLEELLPLVRTEKLATRVDIFIEQTAFSPKDATKYLKAAAGMGFNLTVHGDQFSVGGSKVAVALDALSVDHLEASTPEEIDLIGKSLTLATVLPGASIGLGMPFAPARALLDAGAGVVIASDWNPGSAPMGKLLTQAAILATYEHLSMAEVFAGMTVRAAAALKMFDRGRIATGLRADLQAYPVRDYQTILYNQGSIRPHMVWAGGQQI